MVFAVPRVQVVPLVDDAVSFQVEGSERLRWNAARRYVRPHLFPVLGPSGRSVTRMGHPAAPDHDHHRSIWFAHRDVGGVNLWEDRPHELQHIQQDQWLHYQDGDTEALAAVRLGWYDGHNTRILQQDLLIVYRPLPLGEAEIELQSAFTTGLDKLAFGKTNFGFLAVRVAKTLSAHYGGGRLRSSAGRVGEKDIYAQPADWMDYSGPMVGETAVPAADQAGPESWEGITYFDHPGNPNQPTRWHVRDDGWMTASVCLERGLSLARGDHLSLRYLLHVHRGDVNVAAAAARHRAFAESVPYKPVTGEPAKPYRSVFVR